MNGAPGPAGPPGATGAAGLNGSDASSLGALAGLHFREGLEGEWVWGAGFGGSFTDGDGVHGFAGGIGYGITDDLGIYGKVSTTLDGDSFGYFVGMDGVLGSSR